MFNFIFIICLIFTVRASINNYIPDQIHLSFGDINSTIIKVVWITHARVPDPFVEYKKHDENIWRSKHGTISEFKSDHYLEYVYQASLDDLFPNTTYYYHCGSPKFGWSEESSFTTLPQPYKNEENWSVNLIIFGDLGVGNAQSLTDIQEEIFQANPLSYPKRHKTLNTTKAKSPTDGVINAILHVGDFAYDMHQDDGLRGRLFMRQIQPIASRVPYITCPGNHEHHGNFSHYKHKLGAGMPGDPEGANMFYSFNMGPAHFISFSTEYYFFWEYGFWQIKKQYEWLEADLKEATKPENLKLRPWIITFGHRPMYCSNWNTDDCTKNSSIVRTGIPFLRWYGLESLFYKYGVDIELWAHEHNYERLWPVYNKKVMNHTDLSDPYIQPLAPIHIITGSAGCSEKHDSFERKQPEWSAFRSLDYGYTKMKIVNKTHLYLEQISVDQGKVIDNIWVIKRKNLSN